MKLERQCIVPTPEPPKPEMSIWSVVLIAVVVEALCLGPICFLHYCR